MFHSTSYYPLPMQWPVFAQPLLPYYHHQQQCIINAQQQQQQMEEPTPKAIRESLTLHRFLFELLRSEQHADLLRWTGRNGEFELLQPEHVAQLWGLRKSNPSMTYDKMSRGLRAYYGRNIIEKVDNHKFTYRFVRTPPSERPPSRRKRRCPTTPGKASPPKPGPAQVDRARAHFFSIENLLKK